MNVSREARVAGGVWGLLVGDAVGVSYEFCNRNSLPPREQLEMTPPPGWRKSHGGVPTGTWSDDGAHALCLLESLLECGVLDVEDLGDRLLRWYEHGHLAVGGKVFDVGIQTTRALRSLRSGVPAIKAGPAQENANGNGSLMRVLPLALWHKGTDEELVRDAKVQSLVTHGHLRSQLCCALYCLWVRGLLLGREHEDAWLTATESLRELCGAADLAELDGVIQPEKRGGTGSGYVVDCLRSSYTVQFDGDYEEVVKGAIALGNDTDTTAAVAGGAAGVRDGIDAIPKRWLEAMRGRELVEPLLERLLTL